jgi:hypothetical protein
MINDFVFAVALGLLFYLNFFFNPWLKLKEYQTLDAFKNSCKWLLVIIHVLVAVIVIVVIYGNSFIVLV